MTRRPFRTDDIYGYPVPSDPQISPDGSLVAFVVTTANRATDERETAVWVVPSAGGELQQLTPGPADGSPRFSPDGRSLVYLSATSFDEGGSVPQLWTVSLDGGHAAQLTHLERGAGSPVWSPDGSAIAFSAVVDTDPPTDDGAASNRRPVVIDRFGYKLDGFGLRRGLREHIFVTRPDGTTVQLTTDDGDHDGPVWSPDGTEIAFNTPDYVQLGTVLCPRQVSAVEVSSGSVREITSPEAMVTVLDWSPDGRTLLLVGSEEAGLGEPRLWTVDSGGGAMHDLLPEDPGNYMPGWDLEVAGRFSAEGGCVCFGEWRHAMTRVLRVPSSGGAPEELIGGPLNVRAAAFGAESIAFVAGDRESIAELYVADADGQGQKRLTSYQAELWPHVELVAPVVRTFSAPDGTLIHGYVLRSKHVTGPGPVLVDIHGGPYNAWTPTLSEHFLHQQVLAGLGWTVVCVDPRGSASYGEAFMRATTGSWGFADEPDILAAVDHLVAEGEADPDRVAVSGFSYGGYLTAWLTARTDRFAAAVCGVMVCDQVSAQGSDAGPLTSQLVAGGALWESFDRLVECSPIRHVAHVTTPTLILQAEDDLRTPMGQGEQWFQALFSRGIRVQLVRYPQASHFFLLAGAPSQSVDAYDRLVDWVVRHTQTGDRSRTPAPAVNP